MSIAVYVHDLMTMCRVLLLIIGQNDINPKLLQPIVALICKVMAVKKLVCLWNEGIEFFLTLEFWMRLFTMGVTTA